MGENVTGTNAFPEGRARRVRRYRCYHADRFASVASDSQEAKAAG